MVRLHVQRMLSGILGFTRENPSRPKKEMKRLRRFTSQGVRLKRLTTTSYVLEKCCTAQFV